MTNAPPVVSVVDDDDSVREALPDLLHELGFASAAFASAAEFLATDVAGTRCLLLDVSMPGMSGTELQAALLRRGCAIPIVFITAEQDEATRARAVALGAAAYLTKPFTDVALYDAIHTALGAAR